MIRLLISTSTFPLRPGDGIPGFVFDLAKALAKNCEVTVLAPDAPGATRQEQMGDVEVERFTYFWPREQQKLAYGSGMRDNISASWLAWIQPLPYLIAQARAIRSIVARKGIQVLNTHWIIPQGLSAAMALGRSRQVVHVLSIHAGDVFMLQKVPGSRQLARFIASRTDVLLSAGSATREALDQILGFSSSATLQPMGVYNELFRPGPHSQPVESPFPEGYILFFGRLVEKKGLVYLLRAMPKIIEQRPGLGLIVIGYGPLEGELRNETSRLGLEDGVRFVGRKDHSEIIRYLHGTQVAVVPSIVDSRGETEGMPTVVTEALAAGCRVVASDVNGLPDVIRHGENGWLCRQKDPEDLAKKVLMALEEPDSSEILTRALQTAESLDWSQVAENYLETFNRLLEEKDIHVRS
jgi:glycosyltransferase involved in cell wall biosynthesis